MTDKKHDYYQAPKEQAVNHEIDSNNKTWYHRSGRIGRLRYWLYQLFLPCLMMLIIIIFAFLAVAIESMIGIYGARHYTGILINLMFLVMLIFYMIIYPVRRLNDLGQSGWFCIINFIPFINLFFILYLSFAKGDIGANQYGAPPKPNRWYHWFGLVVGFMFTGMFSAIGVQSYNNYKKVFENIEMQQNSEKKTD